jgi:hypothetical protein
MDTPLLVHFILNSLRHMKSVAHGFLMRVVMDLGNVLANNMPFPLSDVGRER